MPLFNITIYGLYDKDDNIFYIGSTILKLKTRHTLHIAEAKSPSTNKNNKCLKLTELNYDFIIKPLTASVWEGENYKIAMCRARYIEDMWIEKHIRAGVVLTNRARRCRSFVDYSNLRKLKKPYDRKHPKLDP